VGDGGDQKKFRRGLIMRSLMRVAALSAALATCCLQSPARAQSVNPGELNNAARAGEQLLRQQQEIQDERQRERDRAQQLPGGEELPKSSAPVTTKTEEGKCIEAKSLDLVGVRLLPKQQVAQLQQAVPGHCFGVPELNSLLRQITDLYVAKGYVTTRAYIPPQNGKDGRLTIVVIEGKVERIEVQPRGSASAATAFPNMTGDVFNLRDAEQGIDQLNRLSTNNAKLDIRPGSTPGSSVLAIVNSPSRRVTGSLSTDDTGVRATGVWQGTATLAADNPLRINDGFLFSYTRNLDGPSPGPAMSRATAVSYSVPYGWWLGSLMYTESAYDTLVTGITHNFVTSGISRNETIRLDRVAFRNQSSKLTVYADVTRRDSENFVAGQRIGASSRVLTLLDLSSNLSVVAGQALWSFDAGLSRGIRALGALQDPTGLPGNAPHGEFLKATAGAGISRGFAPFGVRTQFSSNFSGQWTNDVLYPSEQIAIAGPFAVRGYRDVMLFGDRGFTWRNELGFPFTFAPGNLRPLSIRPFVGADFGKVVAHNDVPGSYLSGHVVGSSFSISPVNLELSWSEASSRSHTVAADHYFFARFVAHF
jgi:hemolysin activation/secretion protein